MKKIIFISVTIFILQSISSIYASSKEQPISIDFSAVEFNATASQYIERPTFSKLIDDYLFIYVDTINNPKEVHKIFTDKNATSSHIELLSKFIKWEAIAKKNGDLLDRNIGTTDRAGSMKYDYDFHSGDAENHYLIITPCSYICVDKLAISFDIEGANRFKSLLEKFSSDKLNNDNVEGKYN